MRWLLKTQVTSGETLLNPLQLLNALTIVEDNSKTKLMYVPVKVNGIEVQAMLDSGATSNFVAMIVAKRLGLEMVQNSSMVKAVNSEAKPV
ncbi:hypothetical protein ACLB2K_051151 [Fragaria x ananassa]